MTPREQAAFAAGIETARPAVAHRAVTIEVRDDAREACCRLRPRRCRGCRRAESVSATGSVRWRTGQNLRQGGVRYREVSGSGVTAACLKSRTKCADYRSVGATSSVGQSACSLNATARASAGDIIARNRLPAQADAQRIAARISLRDKLPLLRPCLHSRTNGVFRPGGDAD